MRIAASCATAFALAFALGFVWASEPTFLRISATSLTQKGFDENLPTPAFVLKKAKVAVKLYQR